MIRIWHGALAVLIAIAFVGQFTLTIKNDTSIVNLFSYFTIQSNLLILVTAALIALNPQRNERWFRILRFAGLIGITVTGIVFATVLAGKADLSGASWVYDKMFHYIAPVAAVVGWVVFRPRTRFEKGDLYALVWPLVWLAYTLIRGEVAAPRTLNFSNELTNYPYPFLDADREGYLSVGISCVVITVLFTGLAALYLWLTKRLANWP
ncbi:MAG: F420-dependent oxidoreductase [Nocardioidaceae bacterium]|nr:F420-dependent oxidoreductase [Nocardioidaceae bacterium]